MWKAVKNPPQPFFLFRIVCRTQSGVFFRGCCKRPKRRGPPPLLSVVCAAFGAGIFLALFCSLKLVLILTAVFLVVLGALAWDP